MQMKGARFALPIVLGLSMVGWPARGEGPCARRPEVRIAVEGAQSPALSRKLMEQIFAELSEQASDDCQSPPAKASVSIEWPVPEHGRVHVTLEQFDKSFDGVRDVDLTRVPKDAIPLALAIAADELLLALHERAQAEARATVPASNGSATPAAPNAQERLPEPTSRTRFSLGVGPVLEYASTPRLGLVGVGQDLAFHWQPWFAVSAHATLVAPLAGSDAGRGIVSPGLRIHVGTPNDKPVGLEGFLGLDLLASLRAGDVVLGVEPHAGTTLRARVAARTELFVELVVGVVPATLRAAPSRTTDPSGAPLVGGVLASASSGVSVDF